MTDIRVTVDGVADVERRLKATSAVIQFALDRTAVEVEDLVEVGVAVHAKTGQLERSIFKARVQGGWEVGHDNQVAPYAKWVHDGSRPHVIRPKDKTMLRWPVAGGFAFAKRVQHPGYGGDAWLRRAANQALPIFERTVNTHMSGV